MRLSALLAMAFSVLPLGATAQDSAARGLAASCAACHGSEGRSVTAEVIALAGLPKQHIVSQMKAFRDGTRPATVMHQLARGYTDAQIDLVAGYFAAQRK
jgi:cytochrome subunit of sulfide dehydrogenase